MADILIMLKLILRSVVLITLVATSFSRDALSIEPREMRLDDDYAKIGQLILTKKANSVDLRQTLNQHGDTFSDQELNQLAQMNLNELSMDATTQDRKIKITIGQKFILSTIKAIISPICKKAEVCKNSCRLEVAGEVVALIVEANPELIPALAALQGVVIDKILPELKSWCGCT